jgi:micrococcal nuclease
MVCTFIKCLLPIPDNSFAALSRIDHHIMLTRLSFSVINTLGMLLLFSPLIASAGKVVSVPDGNTVVVLNADEQITVRVAYIDAPEKGQAFSAPSRQALTKLCLGKDAAYKIARSNDSTHAIAAVTCDGVDVGRAQLERGMAWVDIKQKAESDLIALEAAARQTRRGLWADEKPVPPWEFRRPLRRTKASLASRSDEAICFVDRRGEYRVINGTRRYGC